MLCETKQYRTFVKSETRIRGASELWETGRKQKKSGSVNKKLDDWIPATPQYKHFQFVQIIKKTMAIGHLHTK